MKALKTLAMAAAPLAIAACGTPVAPALPDALQPDAAELRTGQLSARGVQVYECRAAEGRPAWAFVAPEAELFTRGGRHQGWHGAGPFWEAEDGSRVEGRVLARAEAPVAGAIPWLLLEVHSTGGAGRLHDVNRIRRVNTHGGVAPAAGCDAGKLGTRERVAYTADYLLYERR